MDDFPASKVLQKMVQQRSVGTKCLISLPARQVGAFCTQRRGCPERRGSLNTASVLGHGVPEKKPQRLGQEMAMGIPLSPPLFLGTLGGSRICRRVGMEIMLHLVCKGGLVWIFHLI